jgi:predicted MPP superfamily phosphohydrolase
VIGPFLHPKRYPPSRDPRPPVRQLRLNVPIGWVVERLTAPFGRWERARLLTPEVPIRVTGLDPAFAGYRIALVTDMHCGQVVPTWWLEQAGDRCRALAPDLVVLGGDFVSHARSDLASVQKVVSGFHAPDGAVAVLGNHDHWIGAADVANRLARAGAELLLNRHRLLRRGAAVLAVAGVDDFAHGAVRPDDALRGVPTDVPRILVSHNPDLIEYLPEGLRVDLMLSGHTHNGQLHWPLVGPLTVPSQFGRRYLHGLHRFGGTLLYVSAGVGSGAVPLRWGNPPELPVLRLVPAATSTESRTAP